MSDTSEILAGLTPAERALLRQRLKAKQQAVAATPVQPATPRGDDAGRFEPFPLSDVQRLYRRALDDTRPLARRAANVVTDVAIDGPVALLHERLERAFARLIERHELLRMVLTEDGRQRILPAVPRFTIVRIENSTEDDVQRAAHELRGVKTAVGQWPLMDARLFVLAADRARLVVRHDALLVDGTSRAVFFGELFRLLEDPEAELPPLGFTFRECVAALPRIRAGREYAAAAEHWGARIESLPPPPALPRLAAATGELVDLDLGLLPPAGWSALKRRAAEMNVTTTVLALCAFGEVVVRATGGRACALPLVTSYRPPLDGDVEQLVANFNTIHLVAVPESGAPFGERARALQQQLLGDLDHRAFSGFDVLREWKRRGGLAAGATLPVAFNSVVEYSHRAYARGVTPGREAAATFRPRMLDGALVAPYLALLATIYESDGGDLRCKWQVTPDAFPEAVDTLPAQFTTLLTELAR